MPRLLTLLLLAAPLALTRAQDVPEEIPAFEDAPPLPGPVMSPAQFNDGGRSLQNRIIFPKVRKDVAVSVLCGARLAENGDIIDNYCWNMTNQQMGFVNAINRVADQVRLTPASVDGVNCSVWFQYSVEFRKSGDDERIGVFPNWGFNRELYGFDYIGPQLYHAARRSMNCNVNQSFMVSMKIDGDGSIHEPQVINGDPTRECRERFENFIPGARYIPAHFRGQPVPATYVDFWVATPPKWTGRRRTE